MTRHEVPWRALALASMCLFAGAACQAFFGVDSEEEEASTTGEGGGSSTLAASGGTGGTPLPTECACLTPPSGPGWEGPLHVGEYPPNQGPSSCPGGGVPQKRYVGPTPGSCGTCNCGPVAGAVCPTQVLCYPSTNCTGTATDQTSLFDESTDDSCHVPGTPDPWSCQVVQSPPSGGSCAPNAVQAAPAGWQSERVLCAAPTRPECGEGDICAVPDAKGKVCYINAADVPCPVGWDMPYAAYAGYDGEVSCSACACGAPGSLSCPSPDFGYWAFGGIFCYGKQALGTGCANVSGLDGVTSAGMPQPAGGSCAPSGGALLAQPAPTGYTTICCQTPTPPG